MSSFESFVNSVKDSWRVGKAVKIIYGESKASQRFAILITSGLWYAIRVIMDEDHRDKKGPFDLSPQPDWIIHSEHATLKGAEERANKWKSMLENGEFLEMHKDLWAWSPNEKRPSMKVLPKDCATNPNKYLKPGDLIQTDFY
uniref:Uncharacterized protein n=1 Tax=Panagrolaimus sp. ES5 TaxID=591445 RepID=A0AC34FWG9_9BILA